MDFDPRDYDSRDEARSPDRDLESRDRELDPREAFTRDVNLPRGTEREIVRHRDREYTLRGSGHRCTIVLSAHSRPAAARVRCCVFKTDTWTGSSTRSRFPAPTRRTRRTVVFRSIRRGDSRPS
ncbi:MAG: hypothetical protein DMF87_10730 [Acidobacteria bacterium]|nr:MAG: hypothetical protein DMF88_18480 [Acidobacteriota bacterium]PYR79662.1 MAG: hypothetical protein DMF87_10730 [Acidobacteriota bacterium]